MECCCFIDNSEFVSGSDDGNIELWGIQKKKPVYIVKNAHTLSTDVDNGELKDNGRNYNGHIGKCKVSSSRFTASLRKLESSCWFEILFGDTTWFVKDALCFAEKHLTCGH